MRQIALLALSATRTLTPRAWRCHINTLVLGACSVTTWLPH
jgi:hypothetical protein